MSETCRICEADRTGDRMVRASDDIALCARHWSQWVGRYAWPSEVDPPCSAHLILASGEPEGSES